MEKYKYFKFTTNKNEKNRIKALNDKSDLNFLRKLNIDNH